MPGWKKKKKVICPLCGATCKSTDEFCRECGESLEGTFEDEDTGLDNNLFDVSDDPLLDDLDDELGGKDKKQSLIPVILGISAGLVLVAAATLFMLPRIFGNTRQTTSTTQNVKPSVVIGGSGSVTPDTNSANNGNNGTATASSTTGNTVTPVQSANNANTQSTPAQNSTGTQSSTQSQSVQPQSSTGTQSSTQSQSVQPQNSTGTQSSTQSQSVQPQSSTGTQSSTQNQQGQSVQLPVNNNSQTSQPQTQTQTPSQPESQAPAIQIYQGNDTPEPAPGSTPAIQIYSEDSAYVPAPDNSASNGGINVYDNPSAGSTYSGFYRNGDPDPVNGQILSSSATTYLTTADISNLTTKGICYAKNEIYARYGRKFSSSELQNYFNGQSWYRPVYEPRQMDAEIVNMMNDCERKNIEFLSAQEESQMSGGYPLQ